MLVEWIAVSCARTIKVVGWLWVVLAGLAFFELADWTKFAIPLVWLSLIAFAAMLALRRNELLPVSE